MARGGGQQQAEGQEESSVTGGNQEVLQCMLEGALRSGSLDLVRWLHARGVTWDACMLHYAAKSGNEDLVEWMAEAGYDMDQDGNHPREADSWCAPYLAAGQQGDMAMLRCLRRVGYPTPAHDRTLLRAVRAPCCLEVLQWMVDSGFPVCWHEVEQADRERRPAWRCRWSERSVWVHGMWQRAQAQARAGER